MAAMYQRVNSRAMRRSIARTRSQKSFGRVRIWLDSVPSAFYALIASTL
jgi:hypothetical protein